ncbi:MAG: MATE family efflux transporter [Endomicrobia bacterium]|nr:MATE family efflux transporter [Endomicrobiia bacterium]
MQKFKDFLKSFPRHWLVAASAWTSKIIVSLVQIISIRELLLYLGEERYAIYIIAYSLIGWFGLTQFNVGASLQNFISESRARNENYDKYLLASLQIVSLLFIVFLILILFISTPLQSIIFRKFPTIDAPIVLFIGIVSLTSSLTTIIYCIYFAMHKGYIPNILPAVAAIISMITIVIVKRYDHTANIITALLIFTVPQLLLTAGLFFKTFKPFFSSIFKINFETIRLLFIRASKFYIVGILTIIYIQTDYIVASQTLNPEEIIKYGIFIRIFFFPIFIYESLLAASWPVRSEMFVQRNFNELKGMIKRYSYYGITLMLLSSVLIYIFSDLIINILAPGTNIKAEAPFIVSFALYAVIRTIASNYSTFLNSINALRIFAFYMPITILINVTAQYFFSKIYGAQGIVIGLILSVFLTSLWILPLKTYKVLK